MARILESSGIANSHRPSAADGRLPPAPARFTQRLPSQRRGVAVGGSGPAKETVPGPPGAYGRGRIGEELDLLVEGQEEPDQFVGDPFGFRGRGQLTGIDRGPSLTW